ncbi:MAG: hypothetical protein JWM98_1791 [Thermoleophilia bacterium]|nr:hypothetical protein [Thermoleophilia bacterium]
MASHDLGTRIVKLPRPVNRNRASELPGDLDDDGVLGTVRLEIPDRTIIKVLAYVILAALVVSAAHLIASVLILLVVATFLAIALDPAVRLFQRTLRLPRMAAIALILILGAAAMVGFVSALVPPLVDQSTAMAREAPQLGHDLRTHHWIARLDNRYDLIDQASNSAERLPRLLVDQAGSVLAVALSGIAGFFTLVLLTAFLLIEGGAITQGLVNVWPQLAKRRWWSLVQESYASIGGYVAGTLLVALIDGIAVLILLEVIGAPFALPIALWASVWGLLPVVGGVIGSIPAIAAAFSVGPVQGFVALALSLAYHLVARAIMHPAIVGRAIALSPFFVFISILLGDKLLGIIGIVLAIPLAGIAQIVISDRLRRRAGEVETVPVPSIHPPEPEPEPEPEPAPS